MDILAARKKAAERAKQKAAMPADERNVTVLAGPEAASVPPAAEAAAPVHPEVPQQLPNAQRTAAAEPVPPETERTPPENDETVFDDVPDAEEAAPAELETETLAIRLGGEEYLVPVERVREVLKVREATPVPHAREYVTGVISLRGAVLPVIDLARRLGTPAGARDDKSRIVVVGLDDEDAGLIVDRVTGVVRYPAGAVEAVPETVEQDAGAEYLAGIVRKEGKLYILLDLEKAAGK